MTELSLKRQKIADQIRRSEIQKYILSCRAALDIHNSSSTGSPLLTDEQLEAYYQLLQDRNYAQDCLLEFINKINHSDLRIVNSANLLVKIKRVLMHIENKNYRQSANTIAKSICMRIIAQSRKDKNYINNCFRQFIGLISQQELELHSIWSSVAILRSQAFFEFSFNSFIAFITNFQKQIAGIISTILKTMLHFTIVYDKKAEVKLSISNYFQIVRIVNLIFQNYDLGSQDLKWAAKLFSNIIIQHNSPEVLEELVDLPSIMQIFLKAIHQKQQQEYFCTSDTEQAVLELLAIGVMGSKDATQKILKAYPKVIQVLCQKLPVKAPFNKIKAIRPVMWIHQDTSLTLKTLLALTNLAALPQLSFRFISSEVLSQVVQLSAYPSDLVKGEVAIFLWNLLVSSQEQMVQILCEKDALWAIRNCLEGDSYQMGLNYALKCIMHILTLSQYFPQNNLAWNYSMNRVKKQLLRNGSIILIQRHILNNQESISKEAIGIMSMLNGQENQ